MRLVSNHLILLIRKMIILGQLITCGLFSAVLMFLKLKSSAMYSMGYSSFSKGKRPNTPIFDLFQRRGIEVTPITECLF